MTLADRRPEQLHRLINGAGLIEPELAVQAYGAVVLGRYFQEGPTQTGAAESVERLEQQRPAEAAASMLRDDAEILDRAEPEAIFDAIERHGVTHSFLPPTVIYMLLAHPRARTANLSSLRCLIYGGAPMSAEKARQAVELFGPCLAQIYGQSECPCTIAILTPEEHVEAIRDPAKAHRLASCGRPPVFTQVAIIDEDGNLRPAGERGEIGVRGPIVHAGYHNNPEATAQSRVNGWHRTGDIGVFDADGYLYIVDRKKDMIISGGLNVYPGEIEQVIWAHPAVQDCAVIGVPDEKWGEAVKAVIELKPGATLDPSEVLSMCREKLGGYRTPKSVEIWPELPRSAVGKVLKREIRARYWAGRERTI